MCCLGDEGDVCGKSQLEIQAFCQQGPDWWVVRLGGGGMKNGR